MENDENILKKLYPKNVINSRGIKKKWDEYNISKVLNKETGLDMLDAEDVAEEVIRHIIGQGFKEISTNHIREIVCLELTKRGMHKYRNLFSRAINLEDITFKLDKEFLSKYENKQPKWGVLGYITYKRTYARIIENENRKEEFWETIKRVVEGCYSIQKEHCKKLSLPWSDSKAQRSAQKMYEKIWNFKMCSSGRGLWMMGTEFITRHGSMALNNCFEGNTEIITREGIKKIKDCVNTEQELLSKGGKWIKSPIKSFGKQKLVKLTVKKNKFIKEIYCTPDHRWFAKSRKQPYRNKGLIEFKTINLPINSELSQVFGQGIKDKKRSKWKVKSIEHTNIIKEVYCAIVPKYHSFTLEGNIHTGNCGFVSTNDIDIKYTKGFEFLMDALMLGVGVGFDTKGAGKIIIKQPLEGNFDYQIPDSREGWIESLKLVLEAYFIGKQLPNLDFSLIRPKGLPIKGFGGISSGPEPLIDMLDKIKNILSNRIGEKIKSVDIIDIMNLIGTCVVAGNVRRSAELGLGDINDVEFITCKQDKEKLYSHRWASNNSIVAERGSDYSYISEQININGEPGVIWLNNARNYSRMKNEPDFKDINAMGANPCFTGETIIAVADGRNGVCIKDLYEENKEVLVFSGKPINYTNQFGVSDTFSHYKTTIQNSKIIYNGKKKVITIQLSNGSEFKCTPDHLLSTEKGRWIKAINSKGKKLSKFLKNNPKPIIQDKNIIYDDEIYVVNIINNNETKDVYDLKVENNHNFYIITKKDDDNYLNCSGILVHNCAEQTLESFELCNLVETFPSLHDSYDEYQETLKYAYLYAKSVTLINTHWSETNAVMLKNRRIGVSQSGIIEAFNKFGRKTMLDWCDKGYDYLKKLDDTYSNWLCIPKSIKITTVKPSGTISLLPGVTPGIHYPHSKYYIRRIRMAKRSDIVDIVRKAGYTIEDDLYSENSLVIEFPVKKESFERSKNDVSIWEQAENASAYQKWWSDNQVSITISFKPEEASEIKYLLQCYEDKLKSVSFLPLTDHGYKQAPYEEITREKYEEMISKITPINSLEKITDRSSGIVFCDSDKCELKLE